MKTTKEELEKIIDELPSIFKAPSFTASDDEYLSAFVEKFLPAYFTKGLNQFMNRNSKFGWEYDELKEIILDFCSDPLDFEIDESEYQEWIIEEKVSHLKWLQEQHSEWLKLNPTP